MPTTDRPILTTIPALVALVLSRFDPLVDFDSQVSRAAHSAALAHPLWCAAMSAATTTSRSGPLRSAITQSQGPGRPAGTPSAWRCAPDEILLRGCVQLVPRGRRSCWLS